MRRAAFAAWDLKFKPAKENAAANALVEVFVLEVVIPEVTVAWFAGAVTEDCRRWTDICRLLARAFSCWRMNWARDYPKQQSVSQAPCKLPAAVRILNSDCTHPNKMMPIFCLQAVHFLRLI